MTRPYYTIPGEECGPFNIVEGPGGFCEYVHCRCSNDDHLMDQFNDLHETVEAALEIINEAVMHGMPITQKVTDWRNQAVRLVGSAEND